MNLDANLGKAKYIVCILLRDKFVSLVIFPLKFIKKEIYI